MSIHVIENWSQRGAAIVPHAKAHDDRVELYRPYTGDALPPPQQADLIILSGGPMSIRDAGRPGLEFLDRVLQYVDEAVHQGVPILGICLGHQILASVLGGRVEPMGHLEAGIRSIVGDHEEA